MVVLKSPQTTVLQAVLNYKTKWSQRHWMGSDEDYYNTETGTKCSWRFLPNITSFSTAIFPCAAPAQTYLWVQPACLTQGYKNQKMHNKKIMTQLQHVPPIEESLLPLATIHNDNELNWVSLKESPQLPPAAYTEAMERSRCSRMKACMYYWRLCRTRVKLGIHETNPAFCKF